MKTETLSNAQVNELVERDATSYNVSGFTPVTSVFRFVPEQLKTELLACTRSFISDVKMVTLDVDYKKGIIGAFAWIPDDSPNITDKSTMTEKSVIRKPIYCYSQALTDFMKRFCPPDMRRFFNDENNTHLVGIPILIDRMMNIILDKNGDKYANEYGTKPVKTQIRLYANFSKGDDNHSYGRFRFLEVTKSINKEFFQREPKAKKSFKY